MRVLVVQILYKVADSEYRIKIAMKCVASTER